MLAIPDDLVITIDRSPSEAILTPVSQILAVPAVAEPIWDGPDAPAAAPEPPFILFSFGWMRHFAGNGFEDVCRMAARIGAHLAAIEDGWPAAEAHLRSLPVVDTSFRFFVSPQFIPPRHDERTLAALLSGEGCGCQ